MGVITKTSRDPEYITARIKNMVRRKNKLLRAGRVEEAGALSVRVGQAIQNRCKMQMSRYNSMTDVVEMWAAVRRLTGRQQPVARVDGITAESVVNQHYAGVSSDPHYVEPNRKLSTDEGDAISQCVGEWQVFRALDTLRPTATGLDGLPAWFLRVAAPIFCKPVAYIYLCLQTSTVSQQWKEVRIRPVPKVSAPVQHSDFRPISVTPILTRMMERVVVRDYLYPALLTPPPSHFQTNLHFALPGLRQLLSSHYSVQLHICCNQTRTS